MVKTTIKAWLLRETIQSSIFYVFVRFMPLETVFCCVRSQLRSMCSMIVRTIFVYARLLLICSVDCCVFNMFPQVISEVSHCSQYKLSTNYI